MMQILKLQGTDRQLYRLVGPLVMNPKVLQYNNGYPFKTGEHYVWYCNREAKSNGIYSIRNA